MHKKNILANTEILNVWAVTYMFAAKTRRNTWMMQLQLYILSGGWGGVGWGIKIT